jgi:hypothetical protein
MTEIPEIPAFWFDGKAPEQLVRNLFNGPDDIRAVLFRITEEDTKRVDMPVWMANAIRGLRPLSRKFLARVLEQGGFPLLDTAWTRSLGFFGDWVPVEPALEPSGKWMP